MYTKTQWNEGGAPGISADQLRRMEQGIFDSYHSATPIDNVVTALVETAGVLTRVEGRVGGVLRILEELSYTGDNLNTDTVTIYADDGTTILRKWVDTMVYDGGGNLVGPSREVLI